MTMELKPCPFCGAEAELIIREQNWDSGYFEGEIAVVRCSNHDCYIAPEAWSNEARGLNYKADTTEVMERWNMRNNTTIKDKINTRELTRNQRLANGEELCDHHWNGSDNCYECYCTNCDRHIAEVPDKGSVPFKSDAYCSDCSYDNEEKS